MNLANHQTERIPLSLYRAPTLSLDSAITRPRSARRVSTRQMTLWGCTTRGMGRKGRESHVKEPKAEWRVWQTIPTPWELICWIRSRGVRRRFWSWA